MGVGGRSQLLVLATMFEARSLYYLSLQRQASWPASFREVSCLFLLPLCRSIGILDGPSWIWLNTSLWRSKHKPSAFKWHELYTLNHLPSSKSRLLTYFSLEYQGYTVPFLTPYIWSSFLSPFYNAVVLFTHSWPPLGSETPWEQDNIFFPWQPNNVRALEPALTCTCTS